MLVDRRRRGFRPRLFPSSFPLFPFSCLPPSISLPSSCIPFFPRSIYLLFSFLSSFLYLYLLLSFFCPLPVPLSFPFLPPLLHLPSFLTFLPIISFPSPFLYTFLSVTPSFPFLPFLLHLSPILLGFVLVLRRRRGFRCRP